jgi:hypothetical protein
VRLNRVDGVQHPGERIVDLVRNARCKPPKHRRFFPIGELSGEGLALIERVRHGVKSIEQLAEFVGDPAAVAFRDGLHPAFADLLDVTREDAERAQHPRQNKVSAEREGKRQATIHQDKREEDLAPSAQQVGDVDLGEKATDGEPLSAQRPRQPSAPGVVVDEEAIIRREPPAQLVRHHTSDWEAQRIGRCQYLTAGHLDNREAGLDPGVPALRPVQGIERLPHVFSDQRGQDGSGKAIEIRARQQPEVALLILDELPEYDLRDCDRDGDH